MCFFRTHPGLLLLLFCMRKRVLQQRTELWQDTEDAKTKRLLERLVMARCLKKNLGVVVHGPMHDGPMHVVLTPCSSHESEVLMLLSVNTHYVCVLPSPFAVFCRHQLPPPLHCNFSLSGTGAKLALPRIRSWCEFFLLWTAVYVFSVFLLLSL